MGKTLRILMTAVAAGAMMAGMTAAHATLLNFSLTGNVDYADPGNSFGLNTNDSIFGSGVFDDSSLGPGTVSIVLSGTNSLSLTVGSASFTDADDTGGAGYPRLVFVDGVFSYLDFTTGVGSFGFFSAYPCGVTCFEGEDDSFNLIEGTWTSFTTTVVPVPAAVWLFGSGLLGLAGVARRRKALI